MIAVLILLMSALPALEVGTEEWLRVTGGERSSMPAIVASFKLAKENGQATFAWQLAVKHSHSQVLFGGQSRHRKGRLDRARPYEHLVTVVEYPSELLEPR